MSESNDDGENNNDNDNDNKAFGTLSKRQESCCVLYVRYLIESPQ